MHQSLRILVTTTFRPRPDLNAGERRLFALLELLAHKHQVSFCLARAVPLPEADVQALADALSAIGVRFLGQGWERLGRTLLVNWYDVGLFYHFSQAEQLMQGFKERQPLARTIVDSVDVLGKEIFNARN